MVPADRRQRTAISSGDFLTLSPQAIPPSAFPLIPGCGLERPGAPPDVLRMLGIQHRLNHKPRALSGGEQQRVAIARALVNQPTILLADEPTGNLDTENSNAVLELLRFLNRRTGQTILMITHNPEAAAFADRTVAIRDGLMQAA